MNQQKVLFYLLVALAVIGIYLTAMKMCDRLQKAVVKQSRKPDVGFGYTPER